MRKKQARHKGGTKKYMPGKVAALVKWNNRSLLDKMIDNEIPAKELVAWCNGNGFPISLPTMYSYIKQRREAMVNGLTMELLHSKEDTLKKTLEDDALKKAREQGNAQYKENRRKDRAKGKATLEKELADQESAKRIRHDLELLDEVIQKGFETLASIDKINPATAIAAIQLKHKITNGSHGGYTVYGIEEIRRHEAAREKAIQAVLLEFIPEGKHAEVLERMEQLTREYYESIGLGEAYAQMKAREGM